MGFDRFRDSERSGWDARAGLYADATARVTLQSIPALLARARLFHGARVLDAGCGPGYVAGCASLLGAKAEGVDFAQQMVKQAQANFPHLPFQTADIEDLPFAQDSFDAVLSNIVLFHVTDPARAIQEAARVLRADGIFAFSQWLGPARSACYRMMFDVLGAHADMSLADPAPDAYALSDHESVTDMMTAAGFEDIQIEEVPNVLHAPAPGFFDFFMRFGVRIPLILDRQTPAVRDTIRDEIDARAAAFLDGDTYKIPMPSLVVSGRKAAVS
ncbi:class I SAM-dependent methyltransferase [Yoonia sp. 208BN28-4]|uniref:class I SAM-dependent methyltransferase n=1 Tax=Yoonia sp. 208BN28-4 TaxID=3126505 RepID=UPI00309DD6A0